MLIVHEFMATSKTWPSGNTELKPCKLRDLYHFGGVLDTRQRVKAFYSALWICFSAKYRP
jgi:hypothetical protein